MVKTLVDVHGIVNHVSLIKKIDLGLEDELIGVELALLKKFKKRKDQVAIEVRCNSRGQVVCRHSRNTKLCSALQNPKRLKGKGSYRLQGKDE